MKFLSRFAWKSYGEASKHPFMADIIVMLTFDGGFLALGKLNLLNFYQSMNYILFLLLLIELSWLT